MPSVQLVRAIGRWSLAAMAVNAIVGSAVFGLPSVLAGAVGAASVWAVLLAGLAMVVIVSCYAEVASQFSATGGSYLYVRYTFGRFAGLQVGWLNLLTRFTACAAAVNLFVMYLGEFIPVGPAVRFAVVTLLIGTLAVVNYRGVGKGALVSNVSVVAKMVPLALVCVLGVGYIAVHGCSARLGSNGGLDDWSRAMLLLFFAYGGYEAVLIAVGEARDPRRDAPFAVFVGLGVVTLLYVVVQFVVIGVLPDPAHSERPLSDVARLVVGRGGAALIACGALVSVYGFLSAHLLTGSRAMFSLAEHGDFPARFGTIHPVFRTPHVSIVAFAVLIWAFALFGSFSWNVTLSAVSRLVYYAATCAALPVLRRRQPEAVMFRVWGGEVLAGVGVLICVVLLTRVDFSRSAILAGTVGVATVHWLVVRRRPSGSDRSR